MLLCIDSNLASVNEAMISQLPLKKHLRPMRRTGCNCRLLDSF